jgi:C-terminal processing protease CtpA/Prc
VSGPAWLVHDHLAGLQAADPDLSIDDLDPSMLRDVIVVIEGEPVEGMDGLTLSDRTCVGQQVELTVFRDGIEQNASI